MSLKKACLIVKATNSRVGRPLPANTHWLFAINSSRRIQRLTSPINNDRPQMARQIKLNVTVNGLLAPWSSSELLSVPRFICCRGAHALSNDVNILIMRNPPVITVYFNTTVEQTIKFDEAA